MADVLMTLGGFTFSVDTAAYDRLVRSNAWRWPAQDRIGRRPALQYVGAGVETIEIEGRIHPHYKGGLGQLAALRALGDGGKPLLLTDGRGLVWGKFAMHLLEERQSHIADKGAPLQQDFRLSLAHVGAEQNEATP